ncbi:MAG: hypothetical protein ABMA14_02275 [Hyphomonadaceae bacterium]
MSALKRLCVASATSLATVSVLFAATASADNSKQHKHSEGTIVPASITDPADQPSPSGNSFACDDGSRMILDFQTAKDSVDAIVTVHEQTLTLPTSPTEPGIPQIVWSDGYSSLTWSTGVHLMWMSGSTHLMCGRSHHH